MLAPITKEHYDVGNLEGSIFKWVPIIIGTNHTRESVASLQAPLGRLAAKCTKVVGDTYLSGVRGGGWGALNIYFYIFGGGFSFKDLASKQKRGCFLELDACKECYGNANI